MSTPSPEDNNLTVSWVSYILHLIVAVSAITPGGQLGPALLVVVLVMDLVKKGDVTGWEATHFSFRIRTVLWAALLYLITVPLWFFFVLPGWLAWGLISIWFLYRIVLGMVRLNTQRPVTE